jgi:hypothetical protein
MNGTLEIECRTDPKFSENPDKLAGAGSGFPIHQGKAGMLTSVDLGRMAANLRLIDDSTETSTPAHPRGTSSALQTSSIEVVFPRFLPLLQPPWRKVPLSGSNLIQQPQELPSMLLLLLLAYPV